MYEILNYQNNSQEVDVVEVKIDEYERKWYKCIATFYGPKSLEYANKFKEKLENEKNK